MNAIGVRRGSNKIELSYYPRIIALLLYCQQNKIYFMKEKEFRKVPDLAERVNP